MPLTMHNKSIDVTVFENLLTITTYMQGEYTIDVIAPNGQIINKFSSDAESAFSCRVPSKGFYIVSLRKKSTLRSIKCYKKIVF